MAEVCYEKSIIILLHQQDIQLLTKATVRLCLCIKTTTVQILKEHPTLFHLILRVNFIIVSLGGHQPISITENTSIDEFLSNAEAAQKSFEAERGTAAIAVSYRS